MTKSEPSTTRTVFRKESGAVRPRRRGQFRQERGQDKREIRRPFRIGDQASSSSMPVGLKIEGAALLSDQGDTLAPKASTFDGAI